MLLSCTAKRLKEDSQRLSIVRTDKSQHGHFHRHKIKKFVILVFTIICIPQQVRYITQCIKIQQKESCPYDLYFVSLQEVSSKYCQCDKYLVECVHHP